MLRLEALITSFVLFHAFVFAEASSVPSQVSKVPSKDGTLIALECAGKGANLLIVHGGTGDRKRWRPLLPLFASQFNVCAMDRRGHGESGAGSNYSLQKESEDVAAVVDSLPGPVFVLGHSIGALFALEAAFLTKKVAKLVLYEPPLQDLDHSRIADQMEQMIQAGNREQALTTFLSQVVMVSPEEIQRAKLNQEDLTIMSEFMKSGEVTPVIDRRYSLRQVAAAIQYLEEGHARGKVVIALE
jgi:pimeloyl-ACP methyl ester carboxylesterase